jgi:hypothetical protein
VAFVADGQPPVAGQPRDRAFDLSAVLAEAFTSVNAAAGESTCSQERGHDLGCTDEFLGGSVVYTSGYTDGGGSEQKQPIRTVIRRGEQETK